MNDWLVRMCPKPESPLAFGLVGIDSSSLRLDQLGPEEIAESPELRAMAADFPWSRAVYAGAVEKILEAGARLVILDVLLATPREGDEELRKVLARYPGRVVLVSNFSEDTGPDGAAIVRYQPPAEEVVPEEGAAIGFANFWREQSVVRAAPFRMPRPGAGTVFSSPAVALGLLKGGEARDALPDSAYFLASRRALTPEVHFPLWQLFSPREWEANLRNGKVFEGRVIAIGATAPQFHDEFLTPWGVVYGAALHLAVLDAAWTRSFYLVHSSGAAGLAAVLGALGAWFVRLLFRGWGGRALGLGLGALVAWPLALGILSAAGWLPPLFAWWTGLGLGGVAGLATDFWREANERRRARKILDRYVSPSLAKEILEEQTAFLQSLGGARREVTILFSDVRGFTSMSEGAEPASLFRELNDYLGRMVEIILRNGGGVDKFLGDGILAVWGTLGAGQPVEGARAALRTAQEMLDALLDFNRRREQEGLPPWRIGIGVHSGPVLFGNVGSEVRMEPTVIGDSVNLASRIEGLTKGLGIEALFSAATAALAGGEYRKADYVRVVGRAEPVELMTFWPNGFLQEDREMHNAAVEAYRAGNFSAAARLFECLAKKFPGDKLARALQIRAEEMTTQARDGRWDGVFEARSK